MIGITGDLEKYSRVSESEYESPMDDLLKVLHLRFMILSS